MRDAAELPFTLKRTVALVGMMGAGKTAIGAALAKRLEAPFLDSDTAIEEAANLTVAEIFERDGEDFFRQRETEVIARLLAGEPAILSTGGGAFMRAENRALMSSKGVSLWLRADIDLLWQRVKHKSTRPLLAKPNPRQVLSELQAERDPIYALADLVVDAKPEYSIPDMTEQVVATLLTQDGVLEANS